MSQEKEPTFAQKLKANVAHALGNQKKKWEEAKKAKEKKMPTLTKKATGGIFVHLTNYTLSLNFLLILGRKHFGRPGKKILKSHHIFFPSPPPNQTLSKKFSLIFFSFFPILSKIHSTKHTLSLLLVRDLIRMH